MAATGVSALAPGAVRPVVQDHEFMDCVSRRQVPRPPAGPVASAVGGDGIERTAEGAIILPLALLERLRGLQAAYEAAVDTAVVGYGLRGGCAVELGRGLLWPPGVRPVGSE